MVELMEALLEVGHQVEAEAFELEVETLEVEEGVQGEEEVFGDSVLHPNLHHYFVLPRSYHGILDIFPLYNVLGPCRAAYPFHSPSSAPFYRLRLS